MLKVSLESDGEEGKERPVGRKCVGILNGNCVE